MEPAYTAHRAKRDQEEDFSSAQVLLAQLTASQQLKQEEIGKGSQKVWKEKLFRGT